MKQRRNKLSLPAWITLLFILILGSQSAAAQTTPANPLFAKDDVLKIRIEAPFKKLISKASNSKDPYPGQLKLLEGTQNSYGITVAARGRSRRTAYCSFPPLRVKFDNPEQITGEFSGQKSLKLVTHCGKNANFEQYLRLEYGVYRMYNELTPQSLKTRLVFIDYIDSKSGKTIASKQGFFIEDIDDAAKRNGMKEVDVPGNISGKKLNSDSSAKLILFHYMIGNVDWSVRSTRKGSDCCHNTKLMGATKSAQENLVPTPYDFDSSGFVNAKYAEVSGGLSIKNVRQRLYRGFCSDNDKLPALFAEFTQKQSEFTNVLNDIPDLDEKYLKRAKHYLDGFFETIQKPKTVSWRMTSKCR